MSLLVILYCSIKFKIFSIDFLIISQLLENSFKFSKFYSQFESHIKPYTKIKYSSQFH